MADHYATLGVPRNATLDEVRRAWHAAARRHHPDSAGRPDAASEFGALRDAYATLSDATTRTHYDATLDAAPEVRPAVPFSTELAVIERPRPAGPPAGSLWRRALALDAYVPSLRPRPHFVDVLAY